MYADLDQDLVILGECDDTADYYGMQAIMQPETVSSRSHRDKTAHNSNTGLCFGCTTMQYNAPQGTAGRTGTHRRYRRMFTAANVDLHHSSVRYTATEAGWLTLQTPDPHLPSRRRRRLD